MARSPATNFFVSSTFVAATAALASAWMSSRPFPGLWAIGTFVFVAFVLENLHTDLRLAVKGSTSFVIHLAGCLLFGAFWGGAIAGAATLLNQLALRTPGLKLVFNISQRVLAGVVAGTLYVAIGGNLPP